MPNAAYDQLLRFCIHEKKHAVVADADAKTIAVFLVFCSRMETDFFQRQNRLGNPNLHLRMQPGKFLARIAGDVNLPAHILMPSSFKA